LSCLSATIVSWSVIVLFVHLTLYYFSISALAHLILCSIIFVVFMNFRLHLTLAWSIVWGHLTLESENIEFTFLCPRDPLSFSLNCSFTVSALLQHCYCSYSQRSLIFLPTIKLILQARHFVFSTTISLLIILQLCLGNYFSIVLIFTPSQHNRLNFSRFICEVSQSLSLFLPEYF